MGMILASFRESGKMPVHRDWLIIQVKMPNICSEINLRSIVESPSWPELDLGFSSFISFMMKLGVVVTKENLELITLVKKSL